MKYFFFSYVGICSKNRERERKKKQQQQQQQEKLWCSLFHLQDKFRPFQAAVSDGDLAARGGVP